MLKAQGRVNYLLLGNILIIVAIGILMVYQASLVYATERFGNRYHFLILQFMWMSIGLGLAFIVSRMNLATVRKYSFYIWIVSIFFLLLLVLHTPFGPEINGARRWIFLNPEGLLPSIPFLGRVGFQASEFAKLAALLYCATLLTSPKVSDVSEPKFALKYFGVVLLTCGLIFLQPNFSTAMIVGTILTALYFFSGARLSYFLVGTPILILTAGVYVFSSAYRRLRISTLFNPEAIDKAGAGYHINQIMIALGSGGFLGLGLGKSRQKYSYLPEVTADSLFAVIGEELGFVGATIVVFLLMGLIWQCFDLSSKLKDKFSMLICCGVGTWLAAQTFINLGAIIRVIPLTGVPLPLLSYGGSSALFLLIALGLVLNCSRTGVQEA